MQRISLFLPESYIEFLDLMVARDRFPSRSEAIRIAIYNLIQQELMINKEIQKMAHKLKEQEKNMPNSEEIPEIAGNWE